MVYDNIIFQVEDPIAKIIFNRPKALNALNTNLFKELSQALDEIMEIETVRVLILTGAGDKAFVAGADITELAKMNALSSRHFSEMGQIVISKLQKLPIPVICAANGFTLGGGAEVALACDFIYASEKAKFGLPEISLGLIPGFGGTQRLPKLIGTNMAKELMFTGRMINAQEAQAIGLVNRVFSQENLLSETKKIALEIASKGKVSLRSAKQTINKGLSTDIATGLDIERDNFGLCMVSADAQEGISAFLEKRKPEFKGSLNE